MVKEHKRVLKTKVVSSEVKALGGLATILHLYSSSRKLAETLRRQLSLTETLGEASAPKPKTSEEAKFDCVMHC